MKNDRLRYGIALLKIACLALLLSLKLQAKTDVTDHGWNAISGWSPDGKHIAVADSFGITIYNAATLKKRFKVDGDASAVGFFSADGRYYYSVDSQGLNRLNLSNAKSTRVAAIENIHRVYTIGNNGEMVVVSRDKPYDVNRYQIHLIRDGKAPRALAEVTPTAGKFVDDVCVFPHKSDDTVLIYATDQTPPKTNWDSATIAGHRFYSLDLKTGKLAPLSTVSEEDAYSYGFSSMRPVVGKDEVFEIADGLKGNYDLFNPYTGKPVRTLSVPGVEFELGAPGVVISKRTVTKDGSTQYFRDYLQSGTLKTIRNVELPGADTLKKLHGFAPYNVDKNTEWLRLDNKLVALDLEQSAITSEHPTEFTFFRPLGQPKGEADTMILLASGDYGTGDKLIKYDLTNNTIQSTQAAPNPIKYSRFAFHPTEPEFVAISSEGDVHAYRIGRAGLSHINRGPEAFFAEYASDGETIFALESYDFPEVVQFDAAQFPVDPKAIRYESSPPATTMPNSLTDLVVSKSGKWLIQTDSYRSYLNRTTDGKQLATLGEHGIPRDSIGTIDSLPTAYAIAPNDASFANLSTQKDWDQNGDVIHRTTLNLTPISDDISDETEPTWSVKLPNAAYRLIGYTDDSQAVRLLNLQSGDIESYAASNGEPTGKQSTQLQLAADSFEDPDLFSPHDLSQSPSGTHLVVKDRQRIDVINLSTGTVTTHTLSDPINEVHFPAGGELFAVQTESGELLFYPLDATESNEPKAVLTFYNDGNDYLLQSANGQFDASRLLQERGVYQQGVALLPLNQIFDQSFEPTLFGSLMSGADLPETALDFEQIARAPTAEIRHNTNYTDRVQLKLSAKSPIGQLTTVQLYQNDKLVKEFDPKARDLFYEEFELPLLPGENQLQLIATNADGIASTPAVATVTPPQSANEAIEERSAERTLHLLVVGVNEYKNSKYNLNYALPDAEAMLEQIRNASGDLYDNIEVYSVFNLDATSAGIIDEFEKVRANAQPQDVFIFYFAGHGVMSTELEQFYIVPSDVTQIYGAADSLEANGISSRQLRALAETVRAQKQVFILDACNSGGALEAFSERGASQEKAIAQLARATGTHWITASSSSQFATEFAELGHGAFTYVLLQGLNGKADAGDQRVTINELKAYLESELPRISKEYKGSPQYPTSYGYGRDFPISVQN
ncbi:caspase family protein [Cerasicoccus fimbriatus]|uniref:caspase family protein n=1 Tax=Cerasicoccus fimbriatus TaxID=3014554 RepID=UPI0022B5C8B2|nr:caspase family protein [Cerasicoccus sp. TK19100]